MDLGYLNTRIRAWKGELFTKEAYDGLIDTGDMRGLINRFKETIYARDMERAATRYVNESEIVESGLKENLAKVFKGLWDYAPAQARELLRAIFSIWEVYNIKAVLRAKDKGVPPDESISILMPAGEMDEVALKELNQQNDVVGVLNLLSTWGSPYARPIKDAIQKYKRERHLIILELSLDHFTHTYCLSLVDGGGSRRTLNVGAGEIHKKVIEQFVRQRIDTVNISTLLKLSGEEMSPVNLDDYFLEGGDRIDRDEFLKLARSKDKKGLLQGLADVSGDIRWKRALASVEHENAYFLEEQLEELSRQAMCRLSMREPLSIALAICFIYMKIREIKNLRLIARAKIFHIPAIEVKRFIII